MINTEIIDTLLLYLETSGRKKGTTTTLVNALKNNPNSFLVVSNSKLKGHICKTYNLHKHRVLSVHQFIRISRFKLPGPLLFDSDVIIEILSWVLKDKKPKDIYNEHISNNINGIHISNDGKMMYQTTAEGALYSIELEIPFDVSSSIGSTIKHLGSQHVEVVTI